jgi:ribosomal protein L37AE/L43A
MRQLLLMLYPRAWRQRYGAEFLALLEEETPTPRAIVDIGRGAFDAHRMRLAACFYSAGATTGDGTSLSSTRSRRSRKMARKRDGIQCSFCGKNETEVQRLIAGPHVFVCDECIALCNQILAHDDGASPSASAQRPRRRWWAAAWHVCRGALGQPRRKMLNRQSTLTVPAGLAQ